MIAMHSGQEKKFSEYDSMHRRGHTKVLEALRKWLNVNPHPPCRAPLPLLSKVMVGWGMNIGRTGRVEDPAPAHLSQSPFLLSFSLFQDQHVLRFNTGLGEEWTMVSLSLPCSLFPQRLLFRNWTRNLLFNHSRP